MQQYRRNDSACPTTRASNHARLHAHAFAFTGREVNEIMGILHVAELMQPQVNEVAMLKNMHGRQYLGHKPHCIYGRFHVIYLRTQPRRGGSPM